jgi:undecaprenyl-diphosphatase
MTLLKRRWLMLLGVGTTSALLTAMSKQTDATPAGMIALTNTPTTEATTHALNIFQAVVLGLVQGLTEFLPISSSAHLKVVPAVLGWGDPGVAFTAVIQLGSIAAVLWYFWQDLTQITQGAIRAIARSEYDSQDFRMALGIGLGTLPIIVLGLLVKKLIPDYDHSVLRSMAAIGFASIFLSLLLGLAEYLGQRKRNFERLTVKDGVLMGLAQALAIIPGISRSGSTLTAGLLIGLERAAAARFSFLLGIPAITLAGLVELKDVFKEGFSSAEILPIVVGVISAAIFSYAAIAWLLRFLQNQSTWVFIWYRLAFGISILVAIATGLIKNT